MVRTLAEASRAANEDLLAGLGPVVFLEYFDEIVAELVLWCVVWCVG
jgi:hypothetical protein